MAVIISDSATNLSTVNGFYRVEAHNLGFFQNTSNTLAAEKNITVTFANAGNCQGIVLGIYGGVGGVPGSAVITRPITVKLQELVGGTTWTDRATKTLTAAEITNNASKTAGVIITPFEFATPYAVNTTAGIWRFNVTQGTGSNNWVVTSSTTTDIAYATWCDNAVTFADNDTVICKETVTIDKTATFGSVLPTGVTGTGYACVICKSNDGTPDNVSKLVWQNPAAASYTLTIKGVVGMGRFSGFRVGTATNPISIANRAIIDFQTPTVGTISTFYNNNIAAPANLFLYGATETVLMTGIASNAAAGQPNVVTTDATGWANGKLFRIFKATTAEAEKTISSVSGTTITATTNLTYQHLAGGKVVISDPTSFGVYLTNTHASGQSAINFNCFNVEGVRWNGTQFHGGGNTDQIVIDDTIHQQKSTIKNSVITGITSFSGIFGWLRPTQSGFLIDHSTFVGGHVFVNVFASLTSGAIEITNNIFASWSNNGPGLWNSSNLGSKFNNNYCYYVNGGLVRINSSMVKVQIKDNRFWYCLGSVNKQISLIAAFNITDWSGNYYDGCTKGGISIAGATRGCKATDEKFGTEVANATSDINFVTSGYFDFELVSPTGNVTWSNETTTELYYSSPDSNFRITGENDTTNADRVIKPNGILARTGDGLSDTTVHTSGTGKFAIRMQQHNYPERLELEQIIPTGDIKDKSMTVAVWCKINSANYYGANYELPRLTINYDNGTTAYSQASTSTDWQLLFVTFTPSTTYGQITATISSKTDATGSNAYVYFDDFSVLYPAGYRLDLGGLDLWANALPVTPTIATVLSAQDVWTAPSTTDYGANTMGRLSKDTNIKVDDAGILGGVV